MNKKIGFACKYFHHDRTLSPRQLKEIESQYNSSSTTITWLAKQPKRTAEEKLWDILIENAKRTYQLVKYVSELPVNMRMVRLGSDQCAAYTHPDWKYFYQSSDVTNELEKQWKKVGDLARSHSVRLSMHPGQFTVLASDNPDIVERSIEEFEYHADLVRWMGFGKSFQDFKINVHISGRRGPEGIREALPKLSDEARRTITIENDEMSWGLDASLELEKDVALVLDIHHHLIHSNGEYIQPCDDRFKRVIDSWRGVTPVIHYSVSREQAVNNCNPDYLPDIRQLLLEGYKKQKLRAHSDSVWNVQANEWALSFLEYTDIMTETKNKNLSSHQLYQQAIQSGYI